jgi:geranylgeranyl diphosphate synthase type II
MSIKAYEALSGVHQNLPALLRLFNKTAAEVCEGQQLDMDFETRKDVTIDDYLKMITLKTSVLLACSLKMGAICGGSMGDNADKLYEFGKNLGISFQLKDDYLDAFGESGKTGKQIGGDIKSNKKTFLLIQALASADARQAAAINDLLANSPADKVEQMLDLFKATGADNSCSAAILGYSEKAFQYLEEVAIPSSRKQPLFDLARMLLDRTH